MKQKLANGSLLTMLILLCLAVIAYVWSLWSHQQSLYYFCPASGLTIRRTGWDSVNLLSPLIAYSIFLVLVPMTLIIAILRRKIIQAGRKSKERGQT